MPAVSVKPTYEQLLEANAKLAALVKDVADFCDARWAKDEAKANEQPTAALKDAYRAAAQGWHRKANMLRTQAKILEVK